MLNIIINPNSKSGKGLRIWQTVEAMLLDRQVEYKHFFTTPTRNATKIVTRILAASTSDNTTIVLLGGDGTLNEAINGADDYSKVTFACIPSGSGNDFARGINLTKDLEKNVNNILNPSLISEFDYGIVTIDNFSRKYLVSSGIGYDASICYEVNKSRAKHILNRLKLGKLSYVLTALLTLRKQPYFDVTVTIDGETHQLNKVLLIATLIHKYEGGGFMFCPNADPYDKKLDVCVASSISKPYALTILPMVPKGKHTKRKGISIYQAAEITVSSDKDLHIHVDGEQFTIPRGSDAPTTLHRNVTFTNSTDTIKFIT